MPKLTEEQMQMRRAKILSAARKCIIRKGFTATTMSDIAAEASISIGGIYVHFDSKHEIVAAIGGEATREVPSTDFKGLYQALQSESGRDDACLDLNLWAEATRDEVVRQLVDDALNEFRGQAREWAKGRDLANGWAAVVEALALGLEAQRALGRPVPDEVSSVLDQLLATP